MERAVVSGAESRRVRRTLHEALSSWIDLAEAVSAPDLQERVAAVGGAIVRSLLDGHKVLVLGNGGSAAMASHVAAELAGKCVRDRAPLPAINLAESPTALTAIGNDYGFEDVFVRGVLALGRPGDVLIAMSTSGRSPNVLRALDVAQARGLITVLMTGDVHVTPSTATFHLPVPSRSTPRVQEVHLVWAHAWCEAVDHLWAEA